MSEQKAEYLGEATEDVRHEIRDEAPHDFFTMIPHIVEALDLTPYAFRLYAHLKRVTGENKTGKCWKSTKTLAQACRMSAGSVSNAKKELENTYPPLIRIISKTKDNTPYHEITIIDVWQMNSDLGNGLPVHLVKTPLTRSCGELPRSCGETKKSTVKKNTLTTTSISKEVFRTYQSEIGVITPHISNLIGLWLDDPTCPSEWIIDVMKIAADNNKRNWAYCEAILKRWMVEGKTSVKKEPSGPKYSNKQADLLKQLETA